MTAALGPGVKVKSIATGPWKTINVVIKDGPAYGTVWTVNRMEEVPIINIVTGELMIAITLVEWYEVDRWFNSEFFRPIDQIDELEESCRDIITPVTPPKDLVPVG